MVTGHSRGLHDGEGAIMMLDIQRKKKIKQKKKNAPKAQSPFEQQQAESDSNNKLYLYHGQRDNMTVHIHTLANA